MAEEASDEEYEDVAHKQRLKAALHYTIGKICEEVEEAKFNREVIAAINETAFKQCEALATDIEHFAKHAKRTTVGVEDVKLCCRRSPSLLQFISDQSEKLRVAKEEGRRRGQGRRGNKDAPINVDEED